MLLFVRKALRDLRGNLFLNTVTIVAIALAVLIFSAFSLFFQNAENVLTGWIRELRLMVYLTPDLSQPQWEDIGRKIETVPNVGEAVFVSKETALERFRKQLARQASLLDGLTENPLPDAFEVELTVSLETWEKVADIAEAIKKITGVASVEYGQEWLGRFVHILNLFRLTGFGMGALFFMASVFFVANTTRLALYSRRDEIEILRLVGASESYVREPFYIQSILLGCLGGGIGLLILFLLYRILIANAAAMGTTGFILPIRFLSARYCLSIFFGSVFVGWLGCFISLKQFLRSS